MEKGWEEIVIVMSKDCMREGENLKVRGKEEKVQVKTVSKLNTISGRINKRRVRAEY